MTTLHIIISNSVGSWAQVDLIDHFWRAENGFMWILCYMNHLTGFAYPSCLKNKNSKTVGRAVGWISSTAVLSDILQSHNGCQRK
jgi:hypothetical protein